MSIASKAYLVIVERIQTMMRSECEACKASINIFKIFNLRFHILQSKTNTTYLKEQIMKGLKWNRICKII